jgi:hypothetical protein
MAQGRIQPAGYVGDYAEDDTVYFLWSTAQADGASVARGAAGTVAVFIDSGTTEITDGVTDTAEFDGKTGLQLCTIDLSASASYATGKDYSVVCTGMTVDTIANINAVIGSFSIENRTATLSNQAHGGAAATITGKQIAITATSNDDALVLSGSGTGAGIDIDGGTSGAGVEITSGATSGIALNIACGNTHALGGGVKIDGSTKTALEITSASTNQTINLDNTHATNGYTISLRNTGAGGRGIDITNLTGDPLTLTELTAAADIPATPSIENAVMLLYMMARNDSSATATERRVKNDVGTEVLDATMSDDGTTFTQGKLGDA